ncbi:MAG: phosphotransacetylase family protein [Anaerolineae bacterium]|jgi:BioD-like phosphotransacetylase family protein|nr:phosphotransacetylase family protein [Anaerolineae bacterium]MDX9832269.1 phosphotransacetylase family protein [Anaerolineae bacterium]
MVTLYIASTETFSGKSALCVGLGRHFQHDGYRIGYMKPVSTAARLAAGLADEDAEFIQQTFGVPDSMDDMVPVGVTPRVVEAILSGEEIDFQARLMEAYQRVAHGRDVVILEGGSTLREGHIVGLPTAKVADLLGARELVVVKYNDDVQLLDDVLTAQSRLGPSLIGAVLNAVPRQRMPFVQEKVKPGLQERGVPVLAVLPQERLLLSVSVGDLAEFLNGRILCCEEKADELVEHLMVGAMSVDSALTYFRRKPNKAVITGGDRPDIQLAALETSTKCLILTGNLHPSPIILGRAEEVGVPMILVRQDTLTAVEVIERFFGKTRFHLEKKVQRFQEMLEDRFDFAQLYRLLKLGQ